MYALSFFLGTFILAALFSFLNAFLPIEVIVVDFIVTFLSFDAFANAFFSIPVTLYCFPSYLTDFGIVTEALFLTIALTDTVNLSDEVIVYLRFPTVITVPTPALFCVLLVAGVTFCILSVLAVCDVLAPVPATWDCFLQEPLLHFQDHFSP